MNSFGAGQPSAASIRWPLLPHVYATTSQMERQMETYYDLRDLGKFSEIGKDALGLPHKFFDYYGAVFAEGELTEREKALIALAVAHTV